MMNCREVFETGLLYHHYANTAYPLTPHSFMQYASMTAMRYMILLSANGRRRMRFRCIFMCPSASSAASSANMLFWSIPMRRSRMNTLSCC